MNPQRVGQPWQVEYVSNQDRLVFNMTRCKVWKYGNAFSEDCEIDEICLVKVLAR
jgi:hypothetical protein